MWNSTSRAAQIQGIPIASWGLLRVHISLDLSIPWRWCTNHRHMIHLSGMRLRNTNSVKEIKLSSSSLSSLSCALSPWNVGSDVPPTWFVLRFHAAPLHTGSIMALNLTLRYTHMVSDTILASKTQRGMHTAERWSEVCMISLEYYTNTLDIKETDIEICCFLKQNKKKKSSSWSSPYMVKIVSHDPLGINILRPW